MNNDCCGEIQTSACLSVDTVEQGNTLLLVPKSLFQLQDDLQGTSTGTRKSTHSTNQKRKDVFLLFTVV